MPEIINRIFPSSKFQRCLVHVGRNIFQKVSFKNRTEIAADFKEVFWASDKKTAEEILEKFKTKWL